jgi:ABC-type cobalamin/Fe3+-siderophores transport system ATPase subunit
VTPELRVASLTVAGRAAPRLDGVSCTLAPGRPIVVVGPNGAGKSTLLRALAGLLTPQSGAVWVGDQPMSALSRRARAAAVAWLPQVVGPEAGVSAAELVAAARYRFAERWPVALARAREALAGLGAGALADADVGALSGGEAQRVRLAALVAQEAGWWLLDEPANHLDPGVRFAVASVVAARAGAGGGVVWVTHDLGLLAALPRARVLALAAGRIAWSGEADDPALPEALGAVLGVRLAGVQAGGGRAWVAVGPLGAP